jgi:DNA-binding response OmpR family regulator
LGGSFAAIVLDRMLPSMDGLTVCRRLREARVTTPVIMLTAKDSLGDRVQGLETGADDYLGKPFQFQELLARLRALIRRDKVNKASLIQVADLEIDTQTRSARRAGVDLHLTPREYALLEALAANEGRIVTRETILSRVWLNEDNTDNSVSVYVRSLRRKVDEPFSPKLIHTVVGTGYVMRTASREP